MSSNNTDGEDDDVHVTFKDAECVVMIMKKEPKWLLSIQVINNNGIMSFNDIDYKIKIVGIVCTDLFSIF